MPEPAPPRTRARLLLLIGIPYVIFYYPVDIYGLAPVGVYLAALGLWQLRKAGRGRGATPRDAAWRGRGVRRAAARVWRAARTPALLAAAIVILNLGTHRLTPGSLVNDIIRFFTQPLLYPAILWALSSAWFAAGAGAGAAVAALLLYRNRSARGLGAGLFWGGWTLVCFGLAFFTVFKLGPARGGCARMKTPAGVREVLSRNQIAALPGMARALPYDAAVDADRGLVFVSLKQTGRGRGGIVRLDAADGRVQALLETDLPDRWLFRVNEFPERMDINPARRELYALILSPNNNHLLIASYEGRGLTMTSLIRLDAEPNAIYADAPTGRIFVFYAAATRYGFSVFDAATRREILSNREDTFKGSAQHVVADPGTGHIFLTTLGRRRIMEIDPRSMRLVRHQTDWRLVQGLALSARDNLLYVTTPLGRTLDVLDRNSLERRASLALPSGLADAGYDPVSGRVAVGGYMGDVSVFEAGAPWRAAGRVRLGHLLRNVRADGRGAVYVCSGCGVFAVDPGKISE